MKQLVLRVMYSDLNTSPELVAVLNGSHRFLLELVADERSLRYGRFVNFDRYGDHILIEHSVEMIVYGYNTNEMVTWISDNVFGLWTMKLFCENIHEDIKIAFIFNNHVDAVHFALRWR